MFKVYLSRKQTRAMSIDHPIGDPTGGPAYRELRDPVTAIVGSNVIGSAIGAGASSSASKSQSRSADAARKYQYETTQAAIKVQEQVLEAQLRNADNVQKAQIQTQLDSLREQSRIAAETRDAQLGVAGEVLGKQEGAFDPYQQAGLAGQNQLMNYLGIGGGGGPGYGQFATAEFTPEAFAAGQDPGYAFRMKEGLKAVDAQAAARGGLISGAALKASQRFGQDMASQEYQNAFNRYQTTRQNTLAPYERLQGVGFNAAQGLAGAAGGYGTAAGNALGNYGGVAGGAQSAYGTNLTNITGGAGNLINSAYRDYGSNFTGAMTGYGNAQAGLTTGAGNAIAAGTVGQANAINQGISNVSNQYYQNQLLNMLKPQNTYANSPYNNLQDPGGMAQTNIGFSDKRLKTNIQRIGTRSDGLGVYKFEYIWGGGDQIGLMAQEVQNVYPEAIGEANGFLTVDYSKV